MDILNFMNGLGEAFLKFTMVITAFILVFIFLIIVTAISLSIINYIVKTWNSIKKAVRDKEAYDFFIDK